MGVLSSKKGADTNVPTELMEQLRAELVAASGEGRAVFLLGRSAGEVAGVTDEFLRQVRRSGRKTRVAVASAADPEMPAWRRIALRLTARHRTAAALRSSIAEWLFVIPVVGQIASAMLSTVDEISGRGSPTAAHGTGSCLDDVRRILAHGRSDPRLIVLTHCEAADAGELGGAFALIREIRSTRTLLVVSASEASGDTRGFRDLVWEAERLGVGRLVAMEQPLTQSQTDLLRCAASLGSRFETARLVHLMGQSEDQIERRLAELVRSKVLVLHGTIERDGDLTDVYEFVDVAVAARWRSDAAPPEHGGVSSRP